MTLNRFTRRLLAPARLTTRSARGVVIALVLALVWAAPAAAARPSRTLIDLGPFVLPAGTACAFAVEGEPSRGFTRQTVFSDGKVQYSVHALGAYVNLETGARFPTEDTSLVIVRSDLATGIDVDLVNGQNSWSFLPGDIGPFGVVDSPAMYHIIGTVTQTWDNNTNRSIGFAYSGTVIDICAALS
jgi:hypothetical protein